LSRATPEMMTLARRLLDAEAEAGTRPAGSSSVVFRVCERLYRTLSPLTGAAGFRALLSRALVLSSEEVRWLKAVHVKSDGSLEGLAELKQQLSPREIVEGETVLAANLLGLLVTFIGGGLTLQLLQDVWATFDDVRTITPDKNP
jgi:hypothetical protein